MKVAKNDNKGAIGILFGIQRGLRQIMDETEEHFLDQFEIDSVSMIILNHMGVA